MIKKITSWYRKQYFGEIFYTVCVILKSKV